jgi:hypothetical protein
VDFLINTLDEALRILKNQVRKRETVAVCVAGAPEAVEREMLERGVLPDLLPRGVLPDLLPRGVLPDRLPPGEAQGPSIDVFLKQGARRVAPVPGQANKVLVAWHVAQEPARWLPKLDGVALACLDIEDWAGRRWLRLAPRYLGRLAQGVRFLACSPESGGKLVDEIRIHVERGEIAVPVEILLRGPGPQSERWLSL